jgi:hypothetical protein
VKKKVTSAAGKKSRSGLEIFFSIVIYHGECFIAVCSFFLRIALCCNMLLGARLKMHSCLMNGTERAKAPFTLGNRQDAFVERESKLYRRLRRMI